MYLEIYNKDASFHKYVIGSVYRRPSDLLDDLTQFIEEFAETLSNIHAVSRQASVNGDYNIDLLQLHTVVTVFIAHFSRVIHPAEIDRLTAL